jgi:hypothetical protein
MKPWIAPCLLTFSVFSVATGCSSEPSRPAVYPVTGTVTQGGKPVENAQVFFVPTDSKLQPAAAITDANGNYALTTFSQGDGAQPGSYGVKVLKWDRTPPPAAGQDQRFISYEEEQKNYVEDSKPAPPPKNLLPKKYEAEDRSGLSHTVPEGPSTFDIKIE